MAGRPVVVEAITRLNIGGPARHVIDVATGLADRYAIRIAAGHAPAVEGLVATGAVPLDHLPLVRPISPSADLAALVGMRRLLKRHHTELVHSHMAKAGSVARLAATTLQPRPKTVHTFHGHVLAGYFTPGVEQVITRMERQLARRTDRLVAVSADVRDALLDLGIGKPRQFEVIPLGVDLEPFLRVDRPSGQLRRALGLSDETALVGVVARLAPVKDHDTLLRAMVTLAGAHLAVLGDGELRAALGARANELGIANRIHFTSWWDDMPAALADLDVVVLTSRNEGTPMALIEAAAAGRAVVASAVGGVRAVVVDGRTGTVVPPGDPAAVAAALDGLLRNPVRCRRLGQEGRAHVRAGFGLAASLEQIASLYDELLAGRGPVSSRAE